MESPGLSAAVAPLAAPGHLKKPKFILEPRKTRKGGKRLCVFNAILSCVPCLSWSTPTHNDSPAHALRISETNAAVGTWWLSASLDTMPSTK